MCGHVGLGNGIRQAQRTSAHSSVWVCRIVPIGMEIIPKISSSNYSPDRGVIIPNYSGGYALFPQSSALATIRRTNSLRKAPKFSKKPRAAPISQLAPVAGCKNANPKNDTKDPHHVHFVGVRY